MYNCNILGTENLVVKENKHYFRHTKYNRDLIFIFSQKHNNIYVYLVFLLAYLLIIKVVGFIVIFSHMYIDILTSSFVLFNTICFNVLSIQL